MLLATSLAIHLPVIYSDRICLKLLRTQFVANNVICLSDADMFELIFTLLE